MIPLKAVSLPDPEMFGIGPAEFLCSMVHSILDTMPFDAMFRKYRLLSDMTQLKKRIRNKLKHFKK